ncbi:MAG: hypothetical protein CUN51_06545 [Candidatus Thermofonsia Clade 1 bacterium]|uniref:Uncharacterized protein n=1 Tax=Candidatus Thermofonsia Clade 1 bacterium TaxID=2364210 RepID=A0A2M8NZW6_9CHLR|nr:MAG: hypothetical protein CUN51_06545 [Candidatus Thermofonsia Clade 1 bacterium]
MGVMDEQTPEERTFEERREADRLDLYFEKEVEAQALTEALADIAAVFGVSTGDYGDYRTVVHCALSISEEQIAEVRSRVKAYTPPEERSVPIIEGSLDELIEGLGDPLLKRILREIVSMVKRET